ncbi:hypothetical protein [Acetivibrio clariflavus]|jgi:hypothetical protein|uniref:Uncharacterized protein n=1 Tax=Acetivibrio clariflavus (strain DSM 19732 / NBRC 101661 / EBR45) TaxID=720554 RepID=G8M103_ACECE|nr:hypothetical protein [Acetivibrio clariflavus]AEV66944.1 hypothetical protein Clocl_0199 [Acetivibrio clariflavus DSM 19732]
MINLEVLRIELNYLQQVIKDVIGCKASGEIAETIELLVLCFLNPKNYDTYCLSNLQTIEQYLNQIQNKIEPSKYQLLLNNIPTIKTFLEKVKLEMSIS